MLVGTSFFRKCIPYNGKSHVWPQVLAIFTVALIGLTGGALFTWTSPSIPILISNATHLEYVMTLEEASYFTVIPPVASIIAAPCLAAIGNIFGRKQVLTFSALPYVLSWVLILFAKNTYTFYISRFVSGIGDAILFNFVPTYIGEVATPAVRGSWGNMLAVGIYVGQLFMNIIGSYCDIRTTSYIFMCVPLVYAILMLFLPETPYFLIMKDRESDARESLKFLRWKEDVDNELILLTKDVKRQVSESGTLKDVFTIATNRKALLISIAIRGAQQLSGLPAFAVYTQLIFSTAGGNISPSLAAILYNAILCVLVFGFAFVVDKFGRRPLMTFSCLACGIVLLIEATYFYADQNQIIDTTNLKWVPLTGMITYLVVCSSGLGILPTLMLSELFSASVKSKALCVLHMCFSVYVLSVSKLFQTLTSSFGMYVPFYLFAACCFLGTLFSHFCMPETKGKTLEEIQQTLVNRKKKHIEQSAII